MTITKMIFIKETQHFLLVIENVIMMKVKNRLAGIIENDYIRLPIRSERQSVQKKALGLPEFPTTTIGSFPQTKDVKANRSAFRRSEISKQEYVAFNQKKLQNV